jgi:copper transporter 1
MDMGMGAPEHACKISMLWNWYTIDACFISRQWHVRTIGQYAGTVISLFFIMILLEFFRRAAREYDRKIIEGFKSQAQTDSDDVSKLAGGPPTLRPIKSVAFFHRLFFAMGWSKG